MSTLDDVRPRQFYRHKKSEREKNVPYSCQESNPIPLSFSLQLSHYTAYATKCCLDIQGVQLKSGLFLI
jgi:hypothetical protein